MFAFVLTLSEASDVPITVHAHPAHYHFDNLNAAVNHIQTNPNLDGSEINISLTYVSYRDGGIFNWIRGEYSRYHFSATNVYGCGLLTYLDSTEYYIFKDSCREEINETSISKIRTGIYFDYDSGIKDVYDLINRPKIIYKNYVLKNCNELQEYFKCREGELNYDDIANMVDEFDQLKINSFSNGPFDTNVIFKSVKNIQISDIKKEDRYETLSYIRFGNRVEKVNVYFEESYKLLLTLNQIEFNELEIIGNESISVLPSGFKYKSLKLERCNIGLTAEMNIENLVLRGSFVKRLDIFKVSKSIDIQVIMTDFDAGYAVLDGETVEVNLYMGYSYFDFSEKVKHLVVGDFNEYVYLKVKESPSRTYESLYVKKCSEDENLLSVIGMFGSITIDTPSEFWKEENNLFSAVLAGSSVTVTRKEPSAETRQATRAEETLISIVTSYLGSN
jgi:hypothetical protein